MVEKADQTIYERAEIGEKVIHRLRQKLGDERMEVLGHLDTMAICCRNGTVAVVRVDLDDVAE